MSEIRTHRITWKGENPREHEIMEALEDVAEESDETIQKRFSGCWTEWDYRRLHMAKVSRRWPETVFTLEYQGKRIDDRARELYRNGLVQTEEAAWGGGEFDPQKAVPGGPGTMTFDMLDRTSLRDHPGFQCGGMESGFSELEQIHFRDDTGGIVDPAELWYAELVDDEYAIQGSGFLCEDCLKAAGLTREGRPTLLEEMARRARAAA